MKKFILFFGLLVFVIFNVQCAKNIPVSYDAANTNQEVKIHLKSGSSILAIITKKDADQLAVFNETTGKKETLKKDEIASIEKLSAVYDEAGNIISRSEIKTVKGNKNLVLYSIGGTALSFGVSLFASSLIYRSFSDSFKVINPILIGGTALGTGLFSYLGHKRDVRMAVEKIKDQRKILAEKKLKQELTHKKKLELELERLKREKKRTENERKKLLKELKKKDKPE
ncbi:hypothetical protein BMS3Abin05_00977 [bacterium BMS3Abin05]|nr:hypothetical protein BMS3Abin05_00977 [bacterium BMS3Abin05]GBE26573.1 hypothetical protein BMS3Bbin03_00488 [bacterium BMS3Bbin03]HDZ10696.1 hypothetical protein [Bacteroidota bacterium]